MINDLKKLIRRGIFLSALLFLLAGTTVSAQSFQAASGHGNSGYDMGTDVWVDAQGNTYAVGIFENTISFGSKSLTSAGLQDLYIVKYDVSKNFIWANRIGGENNDNTEWNSIRIHGSDAAGRICVTGAIDRNSLVTFTGQAGNLTQAAVSSRNKDIFLASYSFSGDIIWAKVFGGFSGAEPETGMDVRMTESEIYVTGQYWSACTLATNPSVISLPHNGLVKSQIFTAAYSLTGNALWANYAGGSSLDVGISLSLGEPGYVYTSGLCGFANNPATFPGILNPSSSGAVGWGSYVAKFQASNGNWQWLNDQVCGSSVNALVHYDASSNTVYNVGMCGPNLNVRAQNGTEFISSVFDDIYITAFSIAGDFIWTGTEVTLHGDPTSAENVYDFIVVNSSIYVYGNFNSNISFGSHSVSGAGSSDIYIAEFDAANGIVSKLFTDGAASDEFPGALAYDVNKGSFSITGTFLSYSKIGTTNLNGIGYNTFLAEFDRNLPLGLWSSSVKVNSIAYPNPASDIIRVTTPGNTYKILDLRGAELASGSLGYDGNIDVSALMAGTYFIKVEGQGKPELMRFVKL